MSLFPRDLPTTEAGLQEAIDQGLLPEGHFLEFKREIPQGKAENKELGRDLASLTLDGGYLIVGIEEDKASNARALRATSLVGLKERVDQIAANTPDPPVSVRCTEVPASDATAGYLIVEVPPSPHAPHMVDGRYYGRGDSTRRALTDGEVRHLHERRLSKRTQMSDRLRAEIERDPFASTKQGGHLFLVAAPDSPDRELLHRAVTSQGLDPHSFLSTVVRPAVESSTEFAPSIAGWTSAPIPRARGFGVHSSWIDDQRHAVLADHDAEEKALDIEFGDDGTIRLFCGRATMKYKESGANVLFFSLIWGMTLDFARVVAATTSAMRFMGPWDLGVAITDIRDVPLHPGNGFFTGGGYSEDAYIHDVSVLSDEMADARTIAALLLAPLARGLGTTLPD